MNEREYILVVDDDDAVRRMLSNVLEFEGYHVSTAADGKSALASIEECKPNLVILDIIMPDLDGIKVLDLIRRQSDIPVIMLTARHEVTMIRDTLFQGADDYVKKPFSTRVLLARIKAKLRRSHLGDAHSL